MKDSVVIVTGAAGNLGRAVLRSLAAKGARLVAVDRETGALAQALEAAGGAGHLPLAGVDLLSAAACEAMVRSARDSFGRLDALVHTVGGFAAGKIEEADAAQYESMFRLNVLTTVNTFRAVAPVLREAGQGAMIALGAGLGVKAPAGLGAYAASKAAVHRVVESYADELKAHGVRVNALLPSTLDTPLNRQSMPHADHSAWVSLDNLAETIAFLLGPAGRDVTGALIPVTGRVWRRAPPASARPPSPSRPRSRARHDGGRARAHGLIRRRGPARSGR
jgi:NAD(P)-dependent dehydrogenase (short-subunit alcohol dehydrogenase family)